MPLKDHLSSLMVLSYGRTGSVLLAANLRNSLVGNQFQRIQYVKTLPHNFVIPTNTVFHSHLTMQLDTTLNITRVFSIRENPIEHILSFVMVNHFKQHHLQANVDPLSLEPFVFDDWSQIDRLMEKCNIWHRYYVDTLQPNDVVVSYEAFTLGGRANLGNWARIYPDKFKVIKNHMEVADYILSRVSWRDPLDQFLQHVNPFDIYPYTTGATE